MAAPNDPSAQDLGTIADPATCLEYLRVQVPYIVHHLSIADAKAAGIVTYCSIIAGVTAEWLQVQNSPWLRGLGITGIVLNLISILCAIFAMYPRFCPGKDEKDTFSWLGLSGKSSEYPARIHRLPVSEMLEAAADCVQATAGVIRRKYQLVQVGMALAAVTTLIQFVVRCF